MHNLPRRLLFLLFLLFLGLAPGLVWSAGTHGELKVLFDQNLSALPSRALNVRWASDTSIYLVRAHDGVTEVALDEKLTPLRRLIPDVRATNVRRYDLFAASPVAMAVAPDGNHFVWRDLRPSPKFLLARLPAGLTEDLDLSGERLLLLGMPGEDFSSGGIVWLGALDKRNLSAGLKPVLLDVDGAGAPNLTKCSGLHLGAARFMANGSFVVVPGFQQGVHLFSASGRLLRTWDSQALGIENVCGELTLAQGRELQVKPQKRLEFLSEHAILDGVLALSNGPGLIIRAVQDGKVHWTLKVLESGERVLTYLLPITGKAPYDRLRADVRGNRIVALVNAPASDDPAFGNRLVVLEAPSGTEVR